MSNEWPHSIKIGDELTINKEWNETEHPDHHIHGKLIVTGITPLDISQSGLMIAVKDERGNEREFDATWFKHDW